MKSVSSKLNNSLGVVAPLAGAWIEIMKDRIRAGELLGSHPSRVRGLKSDLINKQATIALSHPSRVRGLK